MALKNIVITVNNMQRAKHFYKDVFGLDVILDNDVNVMLTEGLVLQDRDFWEQVTGRQAVSPNNASALYFEVRDIKAFLLRLEQYATGQWAATSYTEESHEPIRYITPLRENGLGKQIVRFYDPDGNLIEVGASI